MALTSEISRAAYVERPPTGRQAIDKEAVAPRVDDNDRRSLAVGLCDVAIRHKCNVNEPEQGDPCTNRNHARDLDAARKALILAGLAPDPYPSVERERKMSPTVTKPVKEGGRAHLERIKAQLAAGPLQDHSWQDRGLCRGENPTLFFGEDGERQAERSIRETKAKQVCAGCPVVAECLDGANTRGEKFGVFGGLTPEERVSRRRRMRRANAA
jgi:WhiB family transcriptional regulator, redox-sensing transcriptional regulator